MSSLIDRLNGQNPNDKRGRKTPSKENVNSMDCYAKYLNEGTVLEVNFDYAAHNGNLSFMDESGIELLMTAEEFKKTNKFYNARIKDKFLGNYLQVKIKEIDAEKNIVYLTPSQDRNNNIKAGIIKELCIAANEERCVPVWGTVLFTNPKQVTVNIFNRNVLGIVDVEDWSWAYIRQLQEHVQVGETINLLLKSMAPRKKGKDIAFLLSRKELHPDPWKELREIEKKAVINVNIIDKPNGKNYAWGLSRRAPGIEIMINKTENISIRVGATYKCKVVDFRPEEKVFKVSAFELVNTRNYNEKTEAYLKKRGEN